MLIWCWVDFDLCFIGVVGYLFVTLLYFIRLLWFCYCLCRDVVFDCLYAWCLIVVFVDWLRPVCSLLVAVVFGYFVGWLLGWGVYLICRLDWVLFTVIGVCGLCLVAFGLWCWCNWLTLWLWWVEFTMLFVFVIVWIWFGEFVIVLLEFIVILVFVWFILWHFICLFVLCFMMVLLLFCIYIACFVMIWIVVIIYVLLFDWFVKLC